MKVAPLQLASLTLCSLFAYFALQWYAAPATFGPQEEKELVIRADLLSEGKSRLQFTTSNATLLLGCNIGQAVCQYVQSRPNVELKVIVAQPEFGGAMWLVSARANEQVLVQFEASEKRLRTHRASLAWGMLFVGLILVGVWLYEWLAPKRHAA